jgi:hypothetical protein
MTMISFSWTIIFRTPVGLVLLGYLIYRYYKKNSVSQPEQPVEFKSEEDEVVDVEYDEFESDDDEYYDDYE